MDEQQGAHAGTTPRRRFQFGLATFLLAALVLGPMLAWLTLQLGFFAAPNLAKGRVLHGGVPASNVTVSFEAVDSALKVTAPTDAQGNFQVGLPPGEYRVGFDNPQGTIDPRYRSAATSAINVSVMPGSNTIDFDLR